MSAISYINAVKARIEGNAALQAYFEEQFGRRLTVKKSYKNREEINVGDLPVLMITRPQVGRSVSGNVTTRSHELLLYLGFHYPNTDDLELPLEYFIEIDERLADAVARKTDLADDRAMYVIVGESANDEGAFHPVYFQTMHLTIKER